MNEELENNPMVKMLLEINRGVKAVVHEAAKKHGIDENDIFYAYYFGTTDGEDEENIASIVDFVVQDRAELDYMLDVIEEGYQENAIDDLLGNVFLN